MKRSQLLRYLIFVSLLAAVFASCAFRYEKPIEDGTATADQENPGNEEDETLDETLNGKTAKISFVRVSNRIFGHVGARDQNVVEKKCLACHHSLPGGKRPLLEGYANVIAALPKIKESVLVKKTMPPRGPLKAKEQELLRKWIDSGAPETVAVEEEDDLDDAPSPVPSANPSPSPTSSAVPIGPSNPTLRPVKWSVLKAKIFEPACISCHYKDNHEGPSGEPLTDQSDHAVVRETIGMTIGLSIMNAEMPPDPAPELTQEQKQLIMDWVIDGMPE